MVSTLALSLFVIGLGLGPLLVGPLSEVYGRSIVYRVSYALFFAFSWPVVFAPNARTQSDFRTLPVLMPFLAVYLLFRFVTGFCVSAFMNVVGGSAADMFSNMQVGKCVSTSCPRYPSVLIQV